MATRERREGKTLVSPDEMSPAGLWRRFRRLPTWGQVAAWIGLVVAVLVAVPAPDEEPEKAAIVTVTQPSVTVTQPPAATAASSSLDATDPPPALVEPPPPALSKPRGPSLSEIQAELDLAADSPSTSAEVDAKVTSATASKIVISAKTPGGGLEGPSTGDLNHAAGTILAAIYGSGRYHQGSVIVFRSARIDTKTGEDLPPVKTGLYRISRSQAARIRWGSPERLAAIEWQNYREYASPSLKPDEGGFG